MAIDGPAGAGKSTVARRVASALGYAFVDTGAMYRCIALTAKRRNISWTDGHALGALARTLSSLRTLTFVPDSDGGTRALVDGEDVEGEIRTSEIAQGASDISTHAEVRTVLVDLQRGLGRDGGAVFEGRDIGTVVFPDAELKFYLTAKPEIRAERRYKDLIERGQTTTVEQTLADVLKRDEQDMNRAVAPLRPASSALVVDSSELSLDETVEALLRSVRAYESRNKSLTP